MTGGTLVNEATGLISSASIGVASYGPNTSIYNAGTIRALDGIGVEIESGSLTNAAGGVIYGYNTGVVASGSGNSPAVISNAGYIVGANGNGVSLSNGGTVINQAGGLIAGGDGIAATGSYAVSIDNAGTVTGVVGVYLGSGGNITTGPPARSPAMSTPST